MKKRKQGTEPDTPVCEGKDWSKLDFTTPIAKVVKQAVRKEIRSEKGDKEERLKNVMVFGLKSDEDNENWNTVKKGISNVLEELSLDDQDLVSWETVRNKNENDVLYRLKFKEKRFAEEALRNAHTLMHTYL